MKLAAKYAGQRLQDSRLDAILDCRLCCVSSQWPHLSHHCVLGETRMFSSRVPRCLRVTIPGLLTFLTIVAAASSTNAAVEAVKGKRYSLHPRNGPWMIFVGSFKDVPEERRTEGGLSAWDAADQLVYELRRAGVPAFTFSHDKEIKAVGSSKLEDGEQPSRHYISRHEEVAVLAGNFKKPDDEMAQKVLTYLKEKYNPAFLKEGGLYAKTPGRKMPFSRAKMTPNPLMPEDQLRRKTDPLIKRLNVNAEHTLLRNPGKYTLRVATFKGSSVTGVGSFTPQKAKSTFQKLFGSSLDESAENARELTHAMRNAERFGYDRNIEAWVFHDRYESYVSIGSFNDRNDPRIAELTRKYMSKRKQFQGKNILTGEQFSVPRNPKPGTPPDKYWLFDVTPKLVEVPRI